MEGVVANPAFWRGKRVLVTGHTGFKGGWLSLWLGHLGAGVVGYALPPTDQPNLFEAARVADGMHSVLGDVRDPDHLRRLIEDQRPEIVFHLAAQPLVRRGYEEPVETYATNVMGTVHLLDAVRRNDGVRAVVNVTSDKCYENLEWEWGYRESDRLGGADPYSNSKGCAELVTAAYRRSYFAPDRHPDHGVAVASARAGNVIGGGDWAADRLLPDLVRAAASGRPLQVRNPEAVRPWQHVLDPLNGYLLLAERLYQDGPGCAESWNFGPEPADARPVRWIADQALAHWPGAPGWEPAAQAGPHEAHTLRLDAARARSGLGWYPRWSLAQGIARAMEWYRAHADGAEMRKFTLGQIETFVHGTPG